MTKERACANEPVLPVSTFENEDAKGMAICAQKVFEDELAKVRHLRARQSDYLASLPTDAAGCLSAALSVLHPQGENLPKGLENSLHLSFALAPMIRQLQTEGPGPMRDALLYIADEVNMGLWQAAREIEHVSEILRNPARVEREARFGNGPNCC